MSQIIKATVPETQKVHMRHARIEIEDGIQNLTDAIFNTILKNNNFRWEDKDKQENLEFIARSIRKLENLQNYFNLPE